MTTPPTREQFCNIITDLIDAAYDSGYYSGQHRDGTREHEKAIARRGYLKELAITAYEFALFYKSEEV